MKYDKGEYHFSSNGKGCNTIGERFCTINLGYSTNDESCIKISLNWALVGPYRYITLLEFNVDFHGSDVQWVF